MFRIGHKVACFDDSGMQGIIKKDQVFTISGITKTWAGEEGLLFAEGPEPPPPYIGFSAKYFRRVTDISSLTSLLQTQKTPENVDA